MELVVIPDQVMSSPTEVVAVLNPASYVGPTQWQSYSSSIGFSRTK
jgi:hypothetical protein